MLLEDLTDFCPSIKINPNLALSDIFKQVYSKTGRGFIFIIIIDEWDYIFNNNLFSESERKEFLEFLRDSLKDRAYVELTYMTGILPIAKYSTGSALNMFREYNILNDKKYDKYFGFTFDETKHCAKNRI